MKRKEGPIRNIWMLTREYGELAGAGGVKDVTAQLSRALAMWSGRKVHVVLPRYGFIHPEEHGFTPLPDPEGGDAELRFEVDMNYTGEERREVVSVWHARLSRVDVYLLDSPRFREKADVYTYTAAEEELDFSRRQGEGHFDYFATNLLLQKGALQLMLLLGQRPDIIHCHDGHTAVLPAILRETVWLRSHFRHTGVVVTVHNAGIGYHQDVDDLAFAQVMTGLPWRSILDARLDGNFDPLLTAGRYATINTVSENYARELQYSDDDARTGWLGHYLLDMGVRLEGITNGVDPQDYNPERGEDIGIAAPYTPLDESTITGKLQCRRWLVEELGREVERDSVDQYGYLEGGETAPLFTFIGRLSTQKGVDVLHAALLELMTQDDSFRMVILGSGTAELEESMIDLARRPEGRGRICFLAGYDPILANRVYSAGDFFVIPSRYEPCGLTDFIAQLFGNIPIVHHVGGLVKVEDSVTGLCYSGDSPSALVGAMTRAMAVFKDTSAMRDMQKQAVNRIEKRHTWKAVKEDYLKLYRQARETARDWNV